jgi:hypothetical protein
MEAVKRGRGEKRVSFLSFLIYIMSCLSLCFLLSSSICPFCCYGGIVKYLKPQWSQAVPELEHH